VGGWFVDGTLDLIDHLLQSEIALHIGRLGVRLLMRRSEGVLYWACDDCGVAWATRDADETSRKGDWIADPHGLTLSSVQMLPVCSAIVSINRWTDTPISAAPNRGDNWCLGLSYRVTRKGTPAGVPAAPSNRTAQTLKNESAWTK